MKMLGNIGILGYTLHRASQSVTVRCTVPNINDQIQIKDLLSIKADVVNTCGCDDANVAFTLPKSDVSLSAVFEKWGIFYRDLLCNRVHMASPYIKDAELELKESNIVFRLPRNGAKILRDLCVNDAQTLVNQIFANYIPEQTVLRVMFEDTMDEDSYTQYINDANAANEAETAKMAKSIAESIERKDAASAEGLGDGEIEDANVVYGNEFVESPIKMSEVSYETQDVVIQGEIFKVDSREITTKKGTKMTLFTAMITDRSYSFVIKVFCDNEKKPKTKRNGYRDIDRLTEGLTEGAYLRVMGNLQYDSYTKEDTIVPTSIIKAKRAIRTDEAPEKRVELHLHTSMSDFDGVTSAADYVKRAYKWGHEAIAITDHGVVQGFAEAYRTWERKLRKPDNLKLIYGMEGYLISDNPDKPKSSYHIIFIAKDKAGLSNLYRLVSEAHLEHFTRGRPRLPRESIEKYREGILVGSACEAGELFAAVVEGKPREKLLEIAQFYDYLEIQPVGNNEFMLRNGTAESWEKLQGFNKTIVSLGEELGKLVVATCDVHFIDPEDEYFRRIMMAGKGFTDADQQAPLYYRTTEEMLTEFAYLGEEKAYEVVVTNTRAIAAMTEQIIPVTDVLEPPQMPNSAEEIRELSQNKAHELYGKALPEIVQSRMDKELESIIKHGFDVMYIIAQKLVKKSNDDGFLVGSRGSVGSSLVAYLSGITEVNSLQPHYRCENPDCCYSEFITDGSYDCGFDMPEKNCPKCGKPLKKDGYDIPFETFLGFDGDKEPDIDLNFSGEYQAKAHKYTEVLFGEGHVFRAGTVSALQDKTAFGYVRKYVEERNVRVNSAEMERLVQGVAGTKQTTGQHPGGIIVVPKEKNVYDFTPIQYPANKKDSGVVTTHLDFNFLHDTLLKLDILGHKDPTTIRMLEDLTGIDATKIQIGEETTMSLFSSPDALGVKPEDIHGIDVGTLGIPEFGTGFTMQMLLDTRPTKFSELIRLSGLSHGTDVWLGNAQELIRNKTCTLEEAICCRDDIMLHLSYLGLPPKAAFSIMEHVRKGKGLTPEEEDLMNENQVPKWYMESCKKIKYMFPKAHAAAYVMMAFRIAWFKVYQPLAFYATWFSVRTSAFDSNLLARGRDVAERAFENVKSQSEKTANDEGFLVVAELVIEMYARGYEFLNVDIYKSHSTRFLIEDGKLRPPLTSLKGLGEKAAESIYNAAKEGSFMSQEDLKQRTGASKTNIDLMIESGCVEHLPETSQLTLFG